MGTAFIICSQVFPCIIKIFIQSVLQHISAIGAYAVSTPKRFTALEIPIEVTVRRQDKFSALVGRLTIRFKGLDKSEKLRVLTVCFRINLDGLCICVTLNLFRLFIRFRLDSALTPSASAP